MRERFMVITMIEMTGYIYDENDDMAPVMDAILQLIGMGVSYGKDDDDEWITRVHHRDMEDAIRDMSPKEEAIICKFFFDKKNILDIQREDEQKCCSEKQRLRKVNDVLHAAGMLVNDQG